jgi:hypothetical protein
MTSATLADYSRHLERFGPECILQTAADDLSEHELGELAAQINSLERVSTFKRGHWVERHQRFRACDECGLDLPSSARANMRRHPHCNSRARRSRSKTLAV